jgi:hypothetical protein
LAGDAIRAAGWVVVAAVKGEPIKVPAPVYYERLAICPECEFNDARQARREARGHPALPGPSGGVVAP